MSVTVLMHLVVISSLNHFYVTI